MKLCIDCKHHRSLGGFHDCLYNSIRRPNLVVGGYMPDDPPLSCYEARGGITENYCGSEGKFWEAKDAQATA